MPASSLDFTVFGPGTFPDKHAIRYFYFLYVYFC